MLGDDALKVRDNLQKNAPLTYAVMAILLAAQSATAEDYFDLSIEQLLQVQVKSVSKKMEAVADAPAAIYVVTSEDIARSGVTTIPDALRMAPGVQVARADSNSWAISIRGFNSTLANKLLVLIDGRSIYNPVFGGVLWEAQDLMLEDIDRIEVVRGPGGTLWGANAVNGVINIITKKAVDTQGTLASAIYGNEETGTVSARQGGVIGDGFYRAYVKAFQRDASQTPAGTTAYDAWDGVRTGFRMDWDEFTFQGDAYRTNAQQRRPHFSLSPPFAPVENQTLVYEGVNLLARWTGHYEDGSQLSLQSYIDWARRDEPINFIDDRTIYDIETQYNFAPLGAHELIAGAGFRFLGSNETGDENVSFSPKRQRNNVYSAFVQDKIRLLPDKLFLTLGTKLEHNDFSGTELQPNARLQFHISNLQTLWAAASHAVRTPTPIEEDLTSTLATAAGVRVAFVPNKAFEAEELTAYEVGYRQQFSEKLSADLTGFYNDYDKLQTTSVQSPVAVTTGPGSPYFLIPVKFTNNMKGQSRGIEAALSWAASQNLKLSLSYSHMKLALTALVKSQEGAELLYPENQAGLKIFWNINRNWTLDTSVYRVDKLPALEVAAYTRLDINLGGQLTQNLRFNLVGQNLLDPIHREFGAVQDINAADVERSIFGKLTWSF